MNRCEIIIIILFCIFLIAVIVIQHLCCRMMMKEKNAGIFHHIKEQTRLARELEHIRIEKETLEKIVECRLNNSDKHHTINNN